MRAYTRWIGIGAAVGIVSALVPVVQGHVVLSDVKAPLAKMAEQAGVPAEPAPPPSLEGLSLTDLTVLPRRVTAPLPGGKTVELTVDPDLQRSATAVMDRYRIPETGAVLMDVKTGKVLVYASRVNEGTPFDVNVRATAPAASVFKVVTSAALIETAGLDGNTEQCYHGGKSLILAEELVDDPKRDKWCATMGMALGRSINVVFARLAQKHLKPPELQAMAGALGFGSPVPFAVPTDAPKVEIPDDPVEFARSAAGFWHTTLSPIEGVSLAQTVANDGMALEPRIVDRIVSGKDEVWKENRPPRVLRRAIRPETAAELRKMMVQTVASGSAFKSFHDKAGQTYFPGVAIAGKTGTLTDHQADRHYTWFVGFAPVESPEVAVAVLVVNTPIWQVKAGDIARDVLRSYFAGRGRPGITRP
ncbi:MAG TPA: penicillin-binding transpeptidase domain-containing protein [Polyangiaceae bacterium]|nr:penicillin-binding transpeptidase domain-containing protein [Polyangiaceae bacterium]